LIVLEFAENNSLSFHGLVSGLIAFLGVRVFLPKSHANGWLFQYGFVPDLRDSMFVKVKIQHRTQSHVCLRGFICPCK